MRCASVFPCIMTMISDFSIIYIFSVFLDSFTKNVTFFCIFLWFYLFFLLAVTFFSFQNQLYFFACSFKESLNFFIQSFLWYKVCLFSIWSNRQVVDIKYAQGICSPISVVEEFLGLFLHASRSVSRFKVSINDIRYFIWHKSFYLVYLRFKFIFCSKRMKAIQTIKISTMSWCYFC